MKTKGVLIIGALLTVACNARFEETTAEIPNAWQIECNSAMESPEGCGDCYLTSYSYIEEIKQRESLQVWIAKIADKQSYYAIQNGDSIQITTIGNQTPFIVDRINEIVEEIDLKNDSLGIVELIWSINSERYISYAIVSNIRGILYDNIGSMITRHLILTRIRTKTDPVDSLPVDDPDTVSTVTRSFSFSNYHYDSFNRLVVVCEMYANSIFDATSKVLVDYNTHCSHTAYHGWKCDAALVYNGVYNSQYATGTWGYGYSFGTPVHVVINGSSVTITGEDHKETGSFMHRADEY